MKNVRNALFLIMFIVLWGCSSTNDSTVTLDANGKHPSGWAVAGTGGNHPGYYRANPDACAECHGSAQNKNSTGGTSGISCFSASRSGITCHPAGPSNHPSGWSAGGSHGSAAKALDPGLHNCTQCHGTNFAGGSGKSCMTCHTAAPHPGAPWRSANGTTHTTTSEANAPECSRCHAGNARLTVPGAVVPSATCFNNALCHGVKHPVGWSAAASHGDAAKGVPDATHGFNSCTQCHGADFSGGTSGASCKSCHSPAPHPDAPWRGTTVTHTSTEQGNASACAVCHLKTPATAPAGTAPGCFNNTLCHGEMVVHAFPNPGSQHRVSSSGCTSCHTMGTAASSYPVAAGTPPACRACHLNANPGTNPHCSDCHGSAATGRPNGTVFPNRAGQHNRSEHVGRACTVCHPFTTGDSRHGWSNRQKSTSAQLNASTGWNAGSKSCSNSCHGSENWY